MRTQVFLALPLLALSATQSYADAYKCTVRSTGDVDSSGRLLEDGAFADSYLGAEFVVDTVTGKMLGAVTNSNEYGTPTVVDPGSEDQAFKVVTIYRPYTSLTYLTILVYEDGPEKTFLYVTGTSVMSGVCREY